MASRRELLQSLLVCLPASVIGRGFEGSKNLAPALDSIAESLKLLPGGWHLYEVGGQSLFAMYGVGGSITTSQVCYLVRETRPNKFEAMAVEFPEIAFLAVGYKPEAVQRLMESRILETIARGKPTRIDLNGGELPMPGLGG